MEAATLYDRYIFYSFIRISSGMRGWRLDGRSGGIAGGNSAFDLDPSVPLCLVVMTKLLSLQRATAVRITIQLLMDSSFPQDRIKRSDLRQVPQSVRF